MSADVDATFAPYEQEQIKSLKMSKKQKIQLKIQLFEEQNMAIKDWIHEVSLSSFIILLLFCFCTDRSIILIFS